MSEVLAWYLLVSLYILGQASSLLADFTVLGFEADNTQRKQRRACLGLVHYID
jgi:hypothetical protein